MRVAGEDYALAAVVAYEIVPALCTGYEMSDWAGYLDCLLDYKGHLMDCRILDCWVDYKDY